VLWFVWSTGWRSRLIVEASSLPKEILMRRWSALLMMALLTSTAALAETKAPEPTADEIIKKALDKGAVGFKQGSAKLRMTITTAKGDAKERSLQVSAMRGSDALLRSMVRFITPADVNGTTYLVVEKKDALPDQYVFVPKAKVVRRIAAGNASSTFFGSDFTYADLMPLPMSETDKVAIEKLADSDVGGQPVYVITVTPKVEGAPYGKVIAYVHKTHLVPLKLEYFDPQQRPLKVLRVKKLQAINGEQTPVELEMKGEGGTKTELVLDEVNPKAELKEADFTEEAMQR
jgi:Outer membrane lipoprotein-sorting protein